jgi:4-amino-4-deoxy-L-arabinose transferase-like glycosyltransferase
MNNRKRNNVFYILALSGLTAVMFTALFGVLGRPPVNSTDEACHGINAYEMLRNNNIWINTLKHETDYYNTKPPLMLWLIMTGYKICGFTPLGMRLPSAIAGLILFLGCCIFLSKRYGRLQTLLFASFLPACTQLFRFHMMRSGDMDALYTLCFSAAMLCLFLSLENPWWILLYGLCFGLAFMTKSTHAALILVIGILFLPVMIRRHLLKPLHYILSALAAVAAVLPWAIHRLSFDGTKFFYYMIFGETLGRVSSNVSCGSDSDPFAYVSQLIHEPVCDIAFVLIAVSVILRLFVFTGRPLHSEVKAALRQTITPLRLLLIIWFTVVVGAYSVVKASLCWYIYPAYIPLMIMAADSGAYLIKCCRRLKNGRIFSSLLLTALIAASLCISVSMICSYPWKSASAGGNADLNFYHNLQDAVQDNPEGFSGRTAFIESSYNIYKPQDEWELDFVYYSETVLDVTCTDGGVQAFLASSDPDAILILDKNLWDTYSPVLTGYVILEDNDYLVFSKQKY